MTKKPSFDYPQVLAWCEAHDQEPAEGWLCLLLDGSLSVDELRAAILEGRDPRTVQTDRLQTDRLVAEMAALPEYRGWGFSYMYPGFFCYIHPDHQLSVFFTPDWEGDETLPIQVQDNEGDCYEEYDERFPLPRDGRTGQQIFDLVRPTLDKLLALPQEASS